MTISTGIHLVFRALFSKNNAGLGKKDILGQPPNETPSELLPSNINQDSEGNDKILGLADRISEKISKQALSKIGMPIDHARSVYVMNSIRVGNISELNQAVALFYLFILRHLTQVYHETG